MIRFCYSIDALSRKPKDARPYQQKANYKIEDLEIKQIAALCGSGHCWRAGIYPEEGKTFKKSEVLAAQVVALDFDAVERSPLEAIEYAANIGIPVSFWYPSFSQNPEVLAGKERLKKGGCDGRTINNLYSPTVQTGDFEYKNGFNFRLVWCLERQIKPREYENVYLLLQNLFECFNPDKATKDCSRLWYGGALGSEVLSEVPLPMAALGALYAKEKVKEGSEPRKVMKQRKGFVPEYADMPEPDTVTVNDGWYQKLQGRCALWDRWAAGQYLNYNERVSLFANLRYLRHSNDHKSVLRDVLRFYNPDIYKGHTCDEEQIRSKFRDSSLKPFPIVKGKLGVPMTMPEFFSADIDAPILPTTKKVSLEVLDKWLDEKVPQFLADKTPDIKILKSQTGSGKTQRIIDCVLSQDLEHQKIIYAAPKHSNLVEVEKRLQDKAAFHQQALIKRCPEKEVSAADVLYLSLGLPAKTKSAKRKGFIDDLFSEDAKGVYLITHSLLTALSGLTANLIIIDEEIDSSLVKETRLELPKLATVIPFLDLSTSQKLLCFIDEVKNRTREDGLDLDLSLLCEEVAPQIEAQIDDYIRSTSTGLLAAGLFECYKTPVGRLSTDSAGNNCVRMVRKSSLVDDAACSNTPVRIFTATPMNKRTEQYYNVSVEVLEAPLADNKGRIIQYAGISGARGMNNDNLPKLSKYIKGVLPQSVIEKSLLLTFKENSRQDKDFWASQGFKLAANNGEQIHLMNNSGLDCFKGKSLIVAGKLDYPQQWYQDIYDDTNDNPQELKRQNKVMELNGVRQKLYLFEDPEIQAIQLQNIQAATEQAAGRARALREEGATVYLFSNLVIKDADEVRE